MRVDGMASPRTISGAMNSGVPRTVEPVAPSTPTLSTSQMRMAPVSGRRKTLPKLMSR